MIIWIENMLRTGIPTKPPQSYEPLEPREGEPRQPNKAYEGLLVAIGPYEGLLGPFPGFCWLI